MKMMDEDERSRFDRGNRDPHRDSAVFRSEDAALWSLLGEVPEVEVSPEFVEATVAKAKAGAELPKPGTLKIWPRWVAAASALAAGIIISVVSWQGPSEIDLQMQAQPGTEAPAEVAEVVELLNSLSDVDLLALEVEDLESVGQDWFGS